MTRRLYALSGADKTRPFSPHRLLAAGDVVTDWFERCLDLHGGLGRSVTAA